MKRKERYKEKAFITVYSLHNGFDAFTASGIYGCRSGGTYTTEFNTGVNSDGKRR